jgi:hypothetical protein
MKQSEPFKLSYREMAYWAMLAVVIMLGIYMLYWVNSTSKDCVANPLVYGVKEFKTSNNVPFTCTCGSQGANGYIFVTKDNATLIQTSVIPNK